MHVYVYMHIYIFYIKFFIPRNCFVQACVLLKIFTHVILRADFHLLSRVRWSLRQKFEVEFLSKDI